MKKTTWCWFPTLMLLAGCAIGPGQQMAQFGDKQGCMAYLAERPLFSIITDGSIRGCSVNNFALLVATYDGQIADSKNGKSVKFRSKSNGKTLDIGGHSYNFAAGRLFLVSVKSDPFTVKQIDAYEEDKIRCLTTSDESIAGFFRGN